jgi:hypothetical protein
MLACLFACPLGSSWQLPQQLLVVVCIWEWAISLYASAAADPALLSAPHALPLHALVSMLLLVGVPWWAAAAFESSCTRQYAAYSRGATQQGLLQRPQQPQGQQPLPEAPAEDSAQGASLRVPSPAAELQTACAGLVAGGPQGQAAAGDAAVGVQRSGSGDSSNLGEHLV